MYMELVCPGCGTSKETDEHVFTECTTYKGLKWAAWEKVCGIIADTTDTDVRTVTMEVPNWIHPISTDPSNNANLWFLAGVPVKVEEWLYLYLTKKERTALWKKIHGIIIGAAHEIWNVRCERNHIKGWTLQDLHLDYLEEALDDENNYLLVDPTNTPSDDGE